MTQFGGRSGLRAHRKHFGYLFGLDQGDISQESAKNRSLSNISVKTRLLLGRAAELCRTPIEAFMQFVCDRRRPPDDGMPRSMNAVSDASPFIALARIGL